MARSLTDRLPPRLRQALQPAAPLLRAFTLWSDAGGMRMAAAMSFYGILSLAPLLIVMVAMLGWWMDRQMLEDTLVAQIGALVGPQGAALVQQALASAQAPGEGLLASLIGFAVLLFGATGVFGELQEALERLWRHGRPPRKQQWWRSASLRLRGIAYILAFGFLMLVSLVISTVLTLFAGWAGEGFGLGALLQLLNEGVALGICAALFLALMRLSTGPKPAARHLLAGAVLGALLFTLGRQLLAMYLSTAAVVSAYGAAGSLVVLLMWIYFSSGVLLLGAACAKALQESRQSDAAARRWASQSPATATPLAPSSSHSPRL